MNNYFALFKLEPQFEIDMSVLDGAYRQLLSQNHPDRHSSSDASKRRRAETEASNINQAYQQLKKPVSRAMHILQLKGHTAVPDAGLRFLEQQIEWRESVEVAKDTANERLLNALEKEVNEYSLSLIKKLQQFIDTEHDYSNGARTALQLQYVEKIRDEIANARFGLEVL